MKSDDFENKIKLLESLTKASRPIILSWEDFGLTNKESNPREFPDYEKELNKLGLEEKKNLYLLAKKPWYNFKRICSNEGIQS
jgi:hypothetical protein